MLGFLEHALSSLGDLSGCPARRSFPYGLDNFRDPGSRADGERMSGGDEPRGYALALQVRRPLAAAGDHPIAVDFEVTHNADEFHLGRNVAVGAIFQNVLALGLGEGAREKHFTLDHGGV